MITYRVSPKITLDLSTLVEKTSGNLNHVLIFWIYSGLNRVSVIRMGGGGGLQNESAFHFRFHFFLGGGGGGGKYTKYLRFALNFFQKSRYSKNHLYLHMGHFLEHPADKPTLHLTSVKFGRPKMAQICLY